VTDRAGGWSARERDWMAQALALGALGEGVTSPNPRVGCLLVRESHVVGRGYHRAAGQPHAEAVAVAEAGDAARGATLYVSLEPCAHQGKTPPCTALLVASGVKLVVAAIRDPNPLVNGKGFERLRDAGIDVSVGLLAEEAGRLNEGFLHWHRTGRPLVTLKAAVTRDGMLSAGEGVSRWITGSAARLFAHRLRLRHDAVLVGAGTVRRDNPRLDVRLAGVRAPRKRVVLTGSLSIDPESRLFAIESGFPLPLVFTREGHPASLQRRFEGRAELIALPDVGDGLDLASMLDVLGRRGVQSVLVEGGGRTHAALLAAGLVDRGAIFVADRLLGARGGTPLIDGFTVAEPLSGWQLETTQQIPLAGDTLLLGTLRRPDREASEPARQG